MSLITKYNLDSLKRFRDTDYYVSNDGDVYHLLKCNKLKKLKGTFIKHPNKRCVVVKINGKVMPIHRVIYESFNGNIPEGMCVVHKNGCQTMNEIGNLILVPRHKDRIYGRRSSWCRRVINIKTGKSYRCINDAAKKENITRLQVRRHCQGKTKKRRYAWYDDINEKYFIGNYNTYKEKYMCEEF